MTRRALPLAFLLFVPAIFAASDANVLTFIQSNCKDCHNASVSSGGIDFSSYTAANTFEQNREVWQRVLNKVNAGEMPPPPLPKPPTAETNAATAWLEAEFARQDKAVQPDAGRVAARRLNRAEYNNTVRDLLGVNIQPADNFPQDQAAFGFDNISDALGLSSVLLEKYADAAEHVVRTAIFGPEKLKPAMTHYSFPVRLNDTRGKATLPDLTNYDLTGLSTKHSAHVTHRFPVEGTYSFRIVTNGHRPNQSMPAQVAFWIDGRMVKQIEVDATDLEGQVREFRTKVTAGEHLLSCSYLKEYSGLPPSYNGPEPSTRPPAPLINARGALTPKDIEILRKLGTTIKTDGIEARIDHRFESLDIGGPFEQTTGPSLASLHNVFICPQHTAACAHMIVANFAARAFRRPLQPKEADTYLSLYTLARKQGDSFEEGVAAALEAVMVSPNFLYRIERSQSTKLTTQTAVPVSDYELASRLSYFLWSSMPDSELMRTAAEQKLHQPAVLEAQVRRMLKDEKARALVDNFAGQWLQFRNIDVMHPDVQRFPEFDENLRSSMRRETEMFVENIVRNDGSLLDFLNADYSFLDERMARFYGIAGVTGPDFRRVDVSKTQRGGGVMAQASILTISSYATRTSPVLRGKWILENLLNDPPAPPPPSVPALDDTKVGQSATLRQQMEAHRANPVCASCHTKMDPLGFGLENLNAIGAWRDQDGKSPVDSTGLLPGGQRFQGPKELKAIMLTKRDAFIAGLSEKMLTYALGRGTERYDRAALKTIEAGVAAHDYRFLQLVLGIVNSLPFEMKRAHEAAALTAAATPSGAPSQ